MPRILARLLSLFRREPDDPAPGKDTSEPSDFLERGALDLLGRTEATLTAAPRGGTEEPVQPDLESVRFHVEELIGRGGMGVVYRARDTRLGRTVAIKMVPPQLAQDGRRLEWLKKEAQVLASLDHPHIAAIFELEDTGERPFLVLQYIEGEALSERLRRGPLPLKEALRLCHQVAAALEAAHASGVVHRDLKPSNISVTPGGSVKVLDFGLAKAMGPAASSAPRGESEALTRGVAGTPGYAAPEQCRGETPDHRADIWSFGCVLFECLSGRRAYDLGSLAEEPSEPDWKALPATLPRALQGLLARCLEPDPSRRPADMGHVRVVLEELSDELAGVRRRRRAVAVGLALATIVALTASTIWLDRRAAYRKEHSRLLGVLYGQTTEAWCGAATSSGFPCPPRESRRRREEDLRNLLELERRWRWGDARIVLRELDMRGADLRGLDLSRADLRGAWLSGARLDDADLRGADLRGARFLALPRPGQAAGVVDEASLGLRHASLDGARLRDAVFSKDTRWPPPMRLDHTTAVSREAVPVDESGEPVPVSCDAPAWPGAPDPCADFCQEDGDPCTVSRDGRCIYSCVERASGSVELDGLPALTADGILYVSGRSIPTSETPGEPGYPYALYALDSATLRFEWGPVYLHERCMRRSADTMRVPAVSEEEQLLFVYGDWNDGASDFCAGLFAKRLSDGGHAWSRELGDPHHRHPLVLRFGRIFYGGYGGKYWIVSQSDGEVIESLAVVEAAENKVGGGSSVIGVDREYYAFQHRPPKMVSWYPEGKRRWLRDLPEAPAPDPLNLAIDNQDRMVTVTSTGTLIGFSGQRGRVDWTTPGDASWPVLIDADGNLYVTARMGDEARVVSFDSGGHMRWFTSLGKARRAAMQFLDDGHDAYDRAGKLPGRAYVATDTGLFALRRDTGRVCWELTTDLPLSGMTATLLHGGNILLCDVGGTLYRLDTRLAYRAVSWARPRGDRLNQGHKQ